MKAPIKVYVTFKDGELITFTATEFRLNEVARLLIILDKQTSDVKVINLDEVRFYEVTVEENNG